MNPGHGNSSDHASDAKVGWDCARLLAMARTAVTLGARLEEQLHAFDAVALHTERGAALSASELDRIVSDTLALQDTVDIMGFVANGLRGREDTLIVAADEVRAEAARALSAGSADLAFVVFAAGMLETTDGFRALADAIATDPSFVSEWSDITVRSLLEAFHESDPAQARRVCLTALIHPDAPWASLDIDALRRLADALRTTDA